MKRLSSPNTITIGPFATKVIALIKKIPRGRVATYGQIAALAGKPRGARGVGWILNSCTESHGLPWQRVINSKGLISFPKKTVEYLNQSRLLRKEGVVVSPQGSISLEKYGWEKKVRKARKPANTPQMF